LRYESSQKAKKEEQSYLTIVQRKLKKDRIKLAKFKPSNIAPGMFPALTDAEVQLLPTVSGIR